MTDVGLCIPVLNEAAVIEPLLRELCAALAHSRYTICIVDDGSTDGTTELIRHVMETNPHITLLERTKTRPGCRRGGASRAGVKWLLDHTAHATFVDFDADGSNDPADLHRAASLVSEGQADVVIASKYVGGSRVLDRPLLRRAGSRIYSRMLGVLLDGAIHDYSNSYRLYSRRAAELLYAATPKHDDPVYLIEMVAVWLSAGLRIVEIPTVYRPRLGGESKVGWKDAIRGFRGGFGVGLSYRAGRYRVAST